MMKTASILIALLACTGLASPARAQTPDPRDYEIGYFVPTNTAIANIYLRQYGSTQGSSLQQSILALRGTYILKFGNLVVTPVDVVVPAVDATAHITTPPSPFGQTTRGSGIADVLFLPTVGYGFTQNEEDHTHTWMALTTYVTFPVGKYRKRQLLNVGRNRWEVTPLIMVGQRFLKAFTVEAMASLGLYANNDKFRIPGLDVDLSLKQDPSFGVSLHLAADLHPTFFIGASYYLAVNGKKTTVLPTGADQVIENETTVHSLRINIGIRLSKTTVLTAQLNEEFHGSDDARLGRLIGLRLSHGFNLIPPESPPSGEKAAIHHDGRAGDVGRRL